jgi:hypothetical protein
MRGAFMKNIIWALIALSALLVVMAVIFGVAGSEPFGVAAEGFSRGSGNLALIAIALLLASKN